MVWVDAAGRFTGHPPLQLAQVRGQAALTAMLTPLAVGFILLARACWPTPRWDDGGWPPGTRTGR